MYCPLTNECIENPYQYINIDERCPDHHLHLKPGFDLDIEMDCQAEETECINFISKPAQEPQEFYGPATTLRSGQFCRINIDATSYVGYMALSDLRGELGVMYPGYSQRQKIRVKDSFN